MKITPRAAAVVGSLALLTTGCSAMTADAPGASTTAAPQESTTASQDARANYHYSTGPAQFSQTCPESGTAYTGTISANGRIGSVCSVITAASVAEAKARGRQDIDADPAGWGHNAKVTIPMTDTRDYRGYIYNRSHLLADSLGGEPTYENLVTGTRTQNVGNNQGGGMGYPESTVREFFAQGAHASCPVTYEATPVYGADPAEVIPRSVTVSMKSCDGAINEQVRVPNTAQGFTINYTNGTYRKD